MVKSENDEGEEKNIKDSIFEPTVIISKSKSGRTVQQKPNAYKDEVEPKLVKKEIKNEFESLTVTIPKKYIKQKKSEPNAIRCCMCQQFFSSNDELESHIPVHSLLIQANLEQKYSKKNKKQCKHCKRKFRLARSLKEHFETPNFTEPPRDRATEYLNKKKRESCQEKVRQEIICPICGKTYSTKILMREHEMRVHSQHLALVCPHPGCDRRFASKTFMNKHIKIHGERTHICDVCGKAFLFLKTLVAHSYRHKEVKRFQCAHCPRTFTYRDMLRRHVESHFEEKIYRCDQCDKTYKWDSDLKRHIQGAHLGDLPFKCKYCNKGYFAMSSRKYHEDRCLMAR